MTITKIDTAEFKRLCKEARLDYDPTYWKTYREQLADILENYLKASWKVSDAWKFGRAAAPTTYAEILDHLGMARLGLMQFAATDAQIATIARLAVRDGLSADQVCGTSGLSKREASAIIADWNRA